MTAFGFENKGSYITGYNEPYYQTYVESYGYKPDAKWVEWRFKMPLKLDERTSRVADIVDENTYKEWLDQRPVYFFGNGAEKCKGVIQAKHAQFVDGIVPQAKYMGQLAETAEQLDIKKMAYYEPFYLKEFVPAASHVKGLN